MKPTKKLGSPEDPVPSQGGPEAVERGEIDPDEAARPPEQGLEGDEGGGGGYGRPREDDDEDHHI